MQCSMLVGYDIINCCSSCHEDEELGYDGGVTLVLPDRDYLVCCMAEKWAREQDNVQVSEDD